MSPDPDKFHIFNDSSRKKRQEILGRIFSGTVESKLLHAEKLYKQLHLLLMNDVKFINYIKDLQTDAAHLTRHMEKMAMAKSCNHCSTSKNGGCCSLAMANETDAIQLLINKLTETKVEKVRDDGRECSYLAEHGCIFKFKPMFCLNYNCGRIMDAASSSELNILGRLTGNILRQQYAVENYILSIIFENTE